MPLVLGTALPLQLWVQQAPEQPLCVALCLPCCSCAVTLVLLHFGLHTPCYSMHVARSKVDSRVHACAYVKAPCRPPPPLC